MHGNRDQGHQTNVDDEDGVFQEWRGDVGRTEEGINGGGVGLGGV